MATIETSPVTGIIAEELVIIDFGEHEGKTVLEIADTIPEYYTYLAEKHMDGKCTIRRSRDKSYRLYVSKISH